MRPVSDRFLESLSGSHLAVYRATVLDSYQDGTTPTGEVIEVIGGDVKCSATADIRSTLNLVTSHSWPRAAGDTLAPYGQELYLERGITYGNAQREFVGLGYFRIDTIEQDTVPDGEITISATDRMSGIRDARFESPRQFASTITNGDLVETLITDVYPDAQISWDDTDVRDDTINRTIITEEDRLAILKDLVTSLGKIGFWRHDGVFRVETPPDVSGTPAWTISAGHDGVLVQMSRSLTREGVYNAVVATGEAGDTTAPARAVARNLTASSPTYYNGRFGPVPLFYSSPFLTTDAQALAAATTLLQQQLGLPYQVDLSSVPNPALEPYDVIEIRYPKKVRSRTLRRERHVVDEVTIPLDPSAPVQLQTREQHVVLIGEAA